MGPAETSGENGPEPELLAIWGEGGPLCIRHAVVGETMGDSADAVGQGSLSSVERLCTGGQH